ncbi:binding-protein-dependent transport systems inner membrane component [Thermobaculum terrenum ATCC BAA-798]|uniref:Binding-protein-dependent transport systems inner membrane component n=1 Tax=Thermobaculum terrenum (strain ATCC BAA-798 / CCMEE 7001 / YNP1) TaxID=525904 RepID=D1CGS4_THET1|nr:sugar ABC transporter permease [Thermobaculum terrenum]ACZ42945.1 binding-protein-dependent transport systems inner membrane component [Thermobaculum terrenum ATCC BAA-798]
MAAISMRGRRANARARRDFLWGLFFTSPAIIGLLWFTAYPLLASFYYSFTSYSLFGGAKWIGLQNYRDLMSDDNWWVSLYNTVYILVGSIPLGIITALVLALLLNMKVRGMAIYRTLFYLPSIVPAVASAVVWAYVFNPQYGILNNILRIFGINGPGWLASPTWAKPALIIMSVWGAGNLMIILLAGLQDVPQEIYDAAKVDGAGWWASFWNVTLPFLSPHLFYALVTGLIAGFQYFTPAYVLTGGNGGPARSTLIAALYLYQNAFRYFKMGYASAMAWILFLIILVITLLTFRTLSRRIYYGGA